MAGVPAAIEPVLPAASVQDASARLMPPVTEAVGAFSVAVTTRPSVPGLTAQSEMVAPLLAVSGTPPAQTPATH